MRKLDAQRRIERRILAQHRVIAKRLGEDPVKVLAHARANLTRWATKYEQTSEPGWMREWRALLGRPVEDVKKVLLGEDEDSIRLRSSSPFAGVLTARERWTILKEADHEAN